MGSYFFGNYSQQDPKDNLFQKKPQDPIPIPRSLGHKNVYLGSMIMGSGIKMIPHNHKGEKKYKIKNEKVIKESAKNVINADNPDKDKEENKNIINEVKENEEKVDNVIMDIRPDENKDNNIIINEEVEKEEIKEIKDNKIERIEDDKGKKKGKGNRVFDENESEADFPEGIVEETIFRGKGYNNKEGINSGLHEFVTPSQNINEEKDIMKTLQEILQEINLMKQKIERLEERVQKIENSLMPNEVKKKKENE